MSLIYDCKENINKKLDCRLRIMVSFDDNVILGQPFFNNYKIGFDTIN